MRRGHAIVVAGTVLAAACARLPAPAEAPGPGAARISGEAIEKRKQLALQYRRSGDLAAAEDQWHILTLVAPHEEAYRTELNTTRGAIARATDERFKAGMTTLRRGDSEAAMQSMLQVLALDPKHAEAARVLRDVEKQRISRIQADRAAKVRREMGAEMPKLARAAPRPADPGQAYDLEQRLEPFKAGDTAGGLKELRRYVDAYPQDKAARQRISSAVYERARELEGQGAKERALPIYEEAVALRGERPAEWSAHIQTLRKTLAGEYYEKGARTYPNDIALAIRSWEACLRFEPQHVNAALRLEEARRLQSKLQRIDSDKAAR